MLTPFPFSISLHLRVLSIQEFFPVATWVTLQILLSSQLADTFDILGKWESFTAVWKEVQMLGFVEQHAEHSRHLKLRKSVLLLGGRQEMIHTLGCFSVSRSSCAAPRVWALGGALGERQMCCESVVTNKKCTEACKWLTNRSNTLDQIRFLERRGRGRA